MTVLRGQSLELVMFGILGDIARVAVGVVSLPVDLAADVVTLGGSLTDQDQPYTAKRAGQIMDALDDAVEGARD